MNQVCAKVYYLISTGEVLLVTSECQDAVQETTKEQDIEKYQQLRDKSIDEIDYVEIEYGTLGTIFNNVLSCSINTETKELNIVYRSQEEIDAELQEIADKQLLHDRANAISDYINLNTLSIDDVENAIIQYELNNIENGVV